MSSHAPGPAPGPAAGDGEPVALEVLSEALCRDLLAGADVGRLAVVVGGQLDIFPVNFVLSGDDLVFRTAEGTKLVEVVLAGQVAFEADGYDAARGLAWSVVVKGHARLLESFDEIYAAQDLPLSPWHAAPKERFVRITPSEVTGRRFARR